MSRHYIHDTMASPAGAMNFKKIQWEISTLLNVHRNFLQRLNFLTISVSKAVDVADILFFCPHPIIFFFHSDQNPNFETAEMRQKRTFQAQTEFAKKRNLENAAFSGFDDDFVVWDIIDGLRPKLHSNAKWPAHPWKK